MTAPIEKYATVIKPSSAMLPPIYDTYLCKDLLSRSPTPEIDLLDLSGSRLRILQSSAGYFSKQGRLRTVERLQLETARLFIEEREWKNAIKILLPLWYTISWRQAGWWNLLEEIDWALKKCAINVGEAETLLAVEWELMNNSFAVKKDWHYDFSRCLEDLGPLDLRPKAILQSEKIKSCMSASFVFCSPQGFVGETLSSQLILVSHAHDISAPIILSQIKLEFSGGLKNVKFLHEPSAIPWLTANNESMHFYNVALQQTNRNTDAAKNMDSRPSEASHFLFGTSDLKLAPGTTKILAFESVPREAGEVEAASVTININAETFDFEIVVTDIDQLNAENMWIKTSSGLSKKRLIGNNSTNVKILPKPPKMLIEIVNQRKSYFTDQVINFEVQLQNGEEASTDVTLEAQFLGVSGEIPDLRWTKNDSLGPGVEDFSHQNVGKAIISLGEMYPGGTRNYQLSFQSGTEAAQYSLQVKAYYYLLPDPDTHISKIVEVQLNFRRPFEANYHLSPRIHRTPWPNYFSADSVSHYDTVSKMNVTPSGLCQKWILSAKIASRSVGSIAIEDVRLQSLANLHDAVCKISQPKHCVDQEATIPPQTAQTRQFELEVQKYDLEDRRATALNLQVEIRWRCEDFSTASAITKLAVPELMIPFGEPRVLAFSQKDQEGDLIHLEYTLENPSQFMLTFNLTMESSEEFAFSGPKAMSLQLVPLSRHTIQYNVLPLAQGMWINPTFRAVDVHFNKILRVHATEGVRSDAKGIYIWVDGGS